MWSIVTQCYGYAWLITVGWLKMLITSLEQNQLELVTNGFDYGLDKEKIADFYGFDFRYKFRFWF